MYIDFNRTNKEQENQLRSKIEQANICENKSKYTLRGFHYQINEYQEGKTISCISGKIYEIVVDIRKSSSTFKQWISFELDNKNKQSLHIPPGCAHAYLTLEDNTKIFYYHI